MIRWLHAYLPSTIWLPLLILIENLYADLDRSYSSALSFTVHCLTLLASLT